MEMTKDLLIQALEQVPGNPKIIISGDAEGNFFHPVTDVTMELYEDGELQEVDEDDEGYSDKHNAFVLWP